MKKRVLLFARSFLAKYYADIESSIIEPIYVTLTHEEKVFLEGRGRRVSGCFEDEYNSLEVADFPGNYLKTSLKSDRFLCRFSHEKRLEILGKEITFWRRIIEETKPDFLVNETVAVEIAEVMAIEAERKGIPFYTYLLGFLPGTFYWKPDPFSGRLNNLEGIVPSEKDFEKANLYITNVREKGVKPFYVSGIKKDNNRFKSLLYAYRISMQEKRESKIANLSGRFKYEDYSIFSQIKLDIKKSAFNNNYDSFENLTNKKVVFFPMHLEPEATLNYFVEENYDQDSLIKLLVGCIKNDQILVVKEHPQQQGMLLTKRFQDIRKRFSNLVYLPSYISSFDVLKMCETVVTLTSTAAWEALIFGKPVFVLGRIFFDQCPGATRIESIKHLKEELHKDSYTVPESEDITLFAAKMISLFHSGCPTPTYKDNTIKEFVGEREKL